MSRIDLQERDLVLFRWLYKFSVLDKDLIMSILDMSSDSYFYERLRKLKRFGYVDSFRRDMYSSNVYFLKQKGVNEIVEPEFRTSKNGKDYVFRPKPARFNIYNYEHELIVAEVGYLMIKKFDLDMDKIVTDRERRIELSKLKSAFKKGKYERIADIYSEELELFIEVEISTKSKNKMYEKVQNYSYKDVLWIVPKENKLLQNRIEDYSRNNRMKIIYLEDIKTHDFSLGIKTKKEVEIEKKEKELERANRELNLINSEEKKVREFIAKSNEWKEKYKKEVNDYEKELEEIKNVLDRPSFLMTRKNREITEDRKSFIERDLHSLHHDDVTYYQNKEEYERDLVIDDEVLQAEKKVQRLEKELNALKGF